LLSLFCLKCGPHDCLERRLWKVHSRGHGCVESCCQMLRRLRGQSSEEYTRYELRRDGGHHRQSSKSSMPSSIPDTSIRRTIQPFNQRAFRISCWHPYQSLCPHPPLNQAIFPNIAGCPALKPPSTAHARKSATLPTSSGKPPLCSGFSCPIFFPLPLALAAS